MTLMSMVKESNFADFNAHPHCGMGTYLYFDDNSVQPLTRYVELEKTLESIEKANEKPRQNKERAKLELASGIIRNIRFGTLARYLSDVIRYSDYRSLNYMHHNMII